MSSLRENIYLIGYPKQNLSGRKLPSKGDCLRVLFYNMRETKLNIADSARLVVRECSIFWDNARIPVQETHRASKRLINLYNEWKTLTKSRFRKSDKNKNSTKEWKDALEDLFDIAHSDAMSIIDNEEDKEFLVKQRLKRREGCMVGVDQNLKKMEPKKISRKQREENRKRKYQEEPSTSKASNILKTVNSDLSESGSDSETNYESEVDFPIANLPQSPKKKQILQPRLVAVLDKLKISQRDTVHLLVAVLDALGLDKSDFNLCRSNLQKERENIRKKQSEKLIQKFSANNQPLNIHWDTKLLTSLTGEIEDRLAIIATAPGFEQIVNMPDIPCGTGLEISSAVYDALEQKNILEKTEAFVFDTTSSNTGRIKGACTLLEKAIGRDILFLGCRHHIFEIVLAAVFSEANLGTSTGPDIVIFKKFKKHWPRLKHENFIPGINHPRVMEILGDDTEKILKFSHEKINESFPRDDYKEFLELVIIFLGGTPPRGIKFTKPGALHYARWMAKAIYCLKILLFRNEFPEINDYEISGLIEVAGFIVKCYTNYWFDSTRADKAPLNDLNFLKVLENYKAVNINIADKAISKMLNHLYYLNEECVAFALFDERLDGETKKKLVAKMFSECEDIEDAPKKLVIKKENLSNFISRDFSAILEELFSKNSQKIFNRFGVSKDFFKMDPKSWNDLDEFKKGMNVIKNLSVVNDCAERGIKLIQEYHGKITKDEDQKQHLMRVVQNYRQKYSKGGASLKSLKMDFDTQ